MMENAYYSVISPEGCSTILFKDATAAPRAAQGATHHESRAPPPGCHGRGRPRAGRGRARLTPPAAGASLRAALVASLAELLPLDAEKLLAQRYERFRKFGTPGQQPVLPPISGET